jgi:protein-disulfide isomerase
MSTGLTDEGHPWIGAERPALEIAEFADYQCFQCRKMHYYLRELVAKYPDKIRLIHRNYPMDHEVNFIVQEPFHVGSGKMALLAIHAAMAGRFWQMNDFLFDLAGNGKDIDLKEVSEKTGLDPLGLAGSLQNPVFRQRLMIDIRSGMKLRILGTPSYLINSKVYEGHIPAEILAPIIEGAAS